MTGDFLFPLPYYSCPEILTIVKLRISGKKPHSYSKKVLKQIEFRKPITRLRRTGIRLGSLLEIQHPTGLGHPTTIIIGLFAGNTAQKSLNSYVAAAIRSIKTG